MGIKGDKKKLDIKVIENTVFLSNYFVSTAKVEVQNITTELRKLRAQGVDNLEGGQGELILASMKSTEATIEKLKDIINGISKSMDGKLGQVVDVYKDKNDIEGAANKIASGKENIALKRK